MIAATVPRQPSAPGLQSAAIADDALYVRFRNNETRIFLAAMLRENSPDPSTTHPVTQERLVSLCELPGDLSVVAADVVDGGTSLRLRFSDGHAVAFNAGALWLMDRAEVIPARVAWDAADASRLPAHDWAEIVRNPAAESRWLSAVQEFGFALVRGTPADPAFLESSATRIGPIRDTNFGRIFDVATTVELTSNAYTEIALGPHTDLATREHQPGLQYLHCITNAAEGGDSLIVDGLALCRRLAAEDPVAWRVLTTTPIPFANKSADCDYRWRGPVIRLGPDGELDTLRFTMWLRAPLVGPIEEVRAVYRALRTIIRLAEDPALVFRFRLRPGDLLLFDNGRILHGRSAFRPETGPRWLRGCYGEREDIASRQRLLARAPAASDPMT
ncbi:MAG: TauD/TfdA family dioxygenase [Proteobacteria bacterium]|nr:TauD/TfdA family dioxygenase [Pseudomonadota bacterium]